MSSWMLVGFLTAEPRWELPWVYLVQPALGSPNPSFPGHHGGGEGKLALSPGPGPVGGRPVGIFLGWGGTSEFPK